MDVLDELTIDVCAQTRATHDWDKVVDTFLRTKGGKLITKVTRTTRLVTMRIIADAIAQEPKLTMDQIARELDRRLVEYSRYRSRMIGRTEVVRAFNFASLEGAKASQLELIKEWITEIDNRTRSSHKPMDGQKRELDEKFDVNGYPADHPGDPSLPGKESIHCRCSQGFNPVDRALRRSPEELYRAAADAMESEVPWTRKQAKVMLDAAHKRIVDAAKKASSTDDLVRRCRKAANGTDDLVAVMYRTIYSKLVPKFGQAQLDALS